VTKAVYIELSFVLEGKTRGAGWMYTQLAMMRGVSEER
jgi:hypothetical protein